MTGRNQPIACIEWHDAVAYVRCLAQKTGKEYRLSRKPAYALVERGDTKGAFYAGPRISTDQSNYIGFRNDYLSAGNNYQIRAVDIGNFPVTGFDVRGMHGNVVEWVEDF